MSHKPHVEYMIRVRLPNPGAYHSGPSGDSDYEDAYRKALSDAMPTGFDFLNPRANEKWAKDSEGRTIVPLYRTTNNDALHICIEEKKVLSDRLEAIEQFVCRDQKLQQWQSERKPIPLEDVDKMEYRSSWGDANKHEEPTLMASACTEEGVELARFPVKISGGAIEGGGFAKCSGIVTHFLVNGHRVGVESFSVIREVNKVHFYLCLDHDQKATEAAWKAFQFPLV